MRIIAGQRRGHKIDGPKASTGTRPTSDMVRESLFNILRDLVADRDVIDLFAGTGALGLEALSRGARRAVFVERDRDNVALIYRNVATLRYQDRAVIRHADAYRWARSYRPEDDRPVIVLLDPPYRAYEIHAKYLNRMLAGLVESLPTGSMIALESGRTLDARILPDLDAWDIRRYGETQLAFLDLSAADRPIPAGDHAEAVNVDEVPPGAPTPAEDQQDE